MDKDREIERMNEREFSTRETAHKETLAAMGIQDEYFDQRPQPSKDDLLKINKIKNWIADELRFIEICKLDTERLQTLGLSTEANERILNKALMNVEKFKDELKKYGVDNVE